MERECDGGSLTESRPWPPSVAIISAEQRLLCQIAVVGAEGEPGVEEQSQRPCERVDAAPPQIREHQVGEVHDALLQLRCTQAAEVPEHGEVEFHPPFVGNRLQQLVQQQDQGPVVPVGAAAEQPG